LRLPGANRSLSDTMDPVDRCSGRGSDGEVRERDREDQMSEDSEQCGRCDRSAIEADDLDNWIANGEGDLICPGCQTQQERIAGARSSLEGMAHLTRLRERRSQ
jgi:hypothetical protein